MSQPAVPLALLLLLAACSDPATEGWEPPALADGWIRYVTPELQLPPLSDQLYCTFATLPQDGAIQDALEWTDSDMLHLSHIVVRPAPDDVGYEDGEVADCTELGDWWASSAPLYETAIKTRNEGLGLPPGVGFPIREGQRFVIDAHFINFTEEWSTAIVGLDLLLMDLDEVKAEAGAMSLDMGDDLVVPVGGRWTNDFSCEFSTAVTLLSVNPHMHERGQEFRLEWQRVDGSTQAVIDIDRWQDTFTEYPPELDYAPGSIVTAPGDVFRTECTWDNDLDHPLVFPEEMCTTIAVGYPLPGGAICMDGMVVPPPDRPGGGPGGGGRLIGSLRSGPAGAALGDVHLLVMPRPPQDGPSDPAANVLFPQVDLSAPNAAVPYTLGGIPTRPEPWTIIAILDADGDWATSPGPGPADLMAFLPEGGLPQIVIDEAGGGSLDLTFGPLPQR